MRHILTRKDFRKDIIKHFCKKLNLDFNQATFAFCGLPLDAMTGQQIEAFKKVIIQRSVQAGVSQ